MIENTEAKRTIWNSYTIITIVINLTGLTPQYRPDGTHYVVQADLKLSNFPSSVLGSSQLNFTYFKLEVDDCSTLDRQ